MNSMLQEWCIFYRSAKKLASPWFPWQKANRICPLDFWLLQEKKALWWCGLWYWHVLFSKSPQKKKRHFYDFWGINSIDRSKNLTLDYKRTTSLSVTSPSLSFLTTLYTFYKLTSTSWKVWVRIVCKSARINTTRL